MCGRFSLITEVEQLAAQYGVVNAGALSAPRFNIAPSQQILAVVAVDGERHLESFRWGLLPHWARSQRPSYATINARAESVESKPAFRVPFRRRRCIIPADGFYEWQGEAGHRRPWRIEPQQRGGLFSFAGLWEVWEQGEEVIRSCTIIVTGANAQMRPIHARMPLMLPERSWSAWLDPLTPLGELREMVRTMPAEPLHLYRVDPYVNNPRHDDPRCLQAAAP